MKAINKVIFVYSGTLAGVLLWIAAIFFAPYLKSQTSEWNRLIYAVFSLICHQIPSRCFYVYGYPLAVCARCFGVYFGFLTGTVFYPFLKGFSKISLPRIKTFILMSLPIVADKIGNVFHLWMTPGWLRFITGLIWGIILPFFFIAGLSDYFINKMKNSRI